jgi:hypothetical protein
MEARRSNRETGYTSSSKADAEIVQPYLHAPLRLPEVQIGLREYFTMLSSDTYAYRLFPLCEISGSCDGDYDKFCLLECEVV